MSPLRFLKRSGNLRWLLFICCVQIWQSPLTELVASKNLFLAWISMGNVQRISLIWHRLLDVNMCLASQNCAQGQILQCLLWLQGLWHWWSFSWVFTADTREVEVCVLGERGHRNLIFHVEAGLGHLWGILMYTTIISPAEEMGYELRMLYGPSTAVTSLGLSGV